MSSTHQTGTGSPEASTRSGELAGARVLVTGGTKGLGAAIARRMAAAGARVVAAARQEDDQPGVRFVRADVSTDKGTHDLAAATLDILGGLDVLVDNVGGQTRAPSGVLGMRDEDWLHDLAVSFLSAVRLDRALLPTMIAQRSGVVVHIGSGAARLPQPAAPAYASAKAALTVYSKGLANEMGRHGIRVNTVLPGVIETPATAAHVEALAAEAGTDVADARRAFVDQFAIPLGRLGHPDDVAELVTFLASPRAAYLTGSQYVVDGGFLPTI